MAGRSRKQDGIIDEFNIQQTHNNEVQSQMTEVSEVKLKYDDIL